MPDQATTNEDQSTRLSVDQVVDLYLTNIAASNSYTIHDFFAGNPQVDQSSHLVALVVAEVQRRLKVGQAPSPRSFFDEFETLADQADAWRVLEAAEPWLRKHDGPQWAKAWQKDFPVIASRFVRPPNNAEEATSIDVDLDNLQPGDCVVDFEIIRFIGAGTFGRVYLAEDLTLHRRCALKVTVDQGIEGQVLAKLDHIGIVNVYREQRIRNRKLLAMQFVSGQSLAEWIEENVSVEPTQQSGQHVAAGVEMIRCVANALQHAHMRGVLHRDIKPANILIDSDGKPMLSDFNVASTGDAGARFMVGGTINYMSPEQLKTFCLNDMDTESDVDTRSDVYSLGVVLLEVLTRQKNWSVSQADTQHATANQLLASRLRSGPPSIISYPGLTASLAAIVDHALQPNPDNRYQSASELETDLGRWLEDLDNLYATNPNHLERIRRHLRHHRYVWTGIVIASCSLLAFIVFNFRSSSRKLTECERMVAGISRLLEERRIPLASETLGSAKVKFLQAGIGSWLQPARYATLNQSIESASKLILNAETSRFTTQFGEIVLTDLYEQETDKSSQLIKTTLETYRVLSSEAWQHEPPFSELDVNRKRSVARRITELMLVSMVRSSQQALPTSEQIERVHNRLPEEHRDLAIFRQWRNLDSLTLPKLSSNAVNDPFESYLWGVLCTINRDHQSAKTFYLSAVRNDDQADFWNHYRLAFTCEKLGDHEQAFIHYGTCIGLQPKFAWPKFNLGLVCFKTSRIDLGETYISQAIQDDQKFTAAYVALMAIHIQQENFEQANDVFDAAMAHGVDSPELAENYRVLESRLLERAKFEP